MKKQMPTEETLFSKRVAYKTVSVLKDEGGVKVCKALRGRSPFQQEVILKIFSNPSGFFTEEWESLTQAASLSCCAKLLNVEFFKNKSALVLESIKGATLYELTRHFQLSKEEISCLMNRIHRGLKELSGQGLFHGDLSFNNILITPKGEVRFIDFGKGNRKSKGTFPFVAPEILKGGGCGLASDLFSLGVICFLLENPHKLNSLKNKPPEYFLPHSPLLQEDPEKRYFPKQKYKETSAPSLNHKVTEILQLKENRWQTEDLPHHSIALPSIKKPLLLVGAWLLLGLIGNNMLSAKWTSREGVLKIHTNQWFHVTLNNFKGYTPVKVPLSSGYYKLIWKSHKKQGEKSLYIPPGKTLVLNDKDFLR